MILSSRSTAHFTIEKKWKFKVILPCRRPHPHLGGRGEGDTQRGTEREKKRELERDQSVLSGKPNVSGVLTSAITFRRKC